MSFKDKTPTLIIPKTDETSEIWNQIDQVLPEQMNTDTTIKTHICGGTLFTIAFKLYKAINSCK